MSFGNDFFEFQFTVSSDRTFFLTKDNLCYAWGNNYYHQLGFKDKENRSVPTLLILPKNHKVALIVCGNNHTLCITREKLCYVWGYNDYGQLGLGDRIERSVPTLLPLSNQKKIISAVCGFNHSICFTDENLCYVWGINFRGQLGLGDVKEHLSPTLFSLPNNEKINFMTSSTGRTMCLTENGLCYVWGMNHNGELGLGDQNDRLTPTLLNLPNNERISFITCGFYHTFCLTENNLCYVWGDNKYGQLGLGEAISSVIPVLTPTLFSLPNNEKISFITCGYHHTMCLTEKNLCYVWGRNDYGQLGLGNIGLRNSPTLLTLPNNEKFSFIGCGAEYSICLTQNNLCYVWGSNIYSQLGIVGACRKPTLFPLNSVYNTE